MRLADTKAEVNLVWLDEVDSTNAYALRLLEALGGDEDEQVPDTVVVARTQSAGRGRGDRRWVSPVGGLYFTWMGVLAAQALGRVPLAAGVALAESVEEALPGGAVGLKWPNDLIVAGRKLGGILCQSRVGGDHAWALVGAGVNIDVEPALGEGPGGAAITLRAAGLAGSSDDHAWALIAGFLARLRALLDDRPRMLESWAARSVHRVGEPMRFRQGGAVSAGAFAGFGPDGELLLRVGDAVRAFPAGELVEQG